MLKKLTPIIIVIAAAAVAFVLINNRRTLEPAAPQPVATAIRVMTVDPAPVQLRVHAQGTVSPRTETQLVPEVAGNVVFEAARVSEVIGLGNTPTDLVISHLGRAAIMEHSLEKPPIRIVIEPRFAAQRISEERSPSSRIVLVFRAVS